MDVTNSLVNDEIGVVTGIINRLDMKPEKVNVQFGTQNYHLERVPSKLLVFPGDYIFPTTATRYNNP